MPSISPEISVRRLEELPSDGGNVVDVLAGANLRIFVGLAQLEAAMKALTTRVAGLETATVNPDSAGHNSTATTALSK
jgi:hypothetical protein